MSGSSGTPPPLPLDITRAEDEALTHLAENAGLSREAQATNLIMDVLAQRARAIKRVGAGAVKKLRRDPS